MLKHLKKHINTNLVELAALLALLFCLLFNSSVILNKYSLYKASGFRAIIELAKDFIIIYAVVFILFTGLCIHKSVLYTGTVILFLTGACTSYYVYSFNIPITKDVIRTAFENDWSEINEMLSLKVIFWAVFSVFVGIYTIHHYKYQDIKSYFSKILIVGCFIISIYNIIYPQYRIITSYFPYKYLNGTYLYLEEKIKKKSRKLDISEFEYKYNSDSNLNVVLVIGESARFDHFSLNGYHRETTPRLKKINNLSSFEATSCACLTYLSVPCMLTRATRDNPTAALEETTFISIFKKLGFRTSWLATQSILKYLHGYSAKTIYDESDFLLLPGGSTLFPMNAHDEVLLPYFDEILSKGDRNLVIIHTSGSHWNYECRYPEQFASFKPGCANEFINKRDPATCDPKGLINSYDNSILYTDFILSEIISRLKNKNSLLIYASDHGESLGEEGRFMHGNNEAKEQFNIPILVWMSDKFIAKHPSYYRNVMTNTSFKISHDYIFHSILDCSGIDSSLIDKRLSICSNKGNFYNN